MNIAGTSCPYPTSKEPPLTYLQLEFNGTENGLNRRGKRTITVQEYITHMGLIKKNVATVHELNIRVKLMNTVQEHISCMGIILKNTWSQPIGTIYVEGKHDHRSGAHYAHGHNLK